jgi:PAS domain-containing protein
MVELVTSPQSSDREAALQQELELLREQLADARAELASLQASAASTSMFSAALAAERPARFPLPDALASLAMDTLTEGITIADVQQPDAPLIYANNGFCRMTGYSLAETVGHNCRHVKPVCVHIPPAQRLIRNRTPPQLPARPVHGRGHRQPAAERHFAGAARCCGATKLPQR